LGTTPVEAATLAALRARLAGGATLPALLAEAGVQLALPQLAPWAHWVTPSAEPRRFSAHFFVAECPAAQEPAFDDDETVEQVWVTPSEGVVRAAELSLPPPQLRTLWELMLLPTVD